MKKSKPKLLIAEVGYEAIRHACLNYHYAKGLPTGKRVGFGVWENDKFIGVVLFSRGSSNTLLQRYGLKPSEGCELTRVALKEHITPVTRIVAIALRELKKQSPGLKLVVSFADSRQGHLGGIYQGGNWIYTGFMETTPDYYYKGKWWHVISINKKIKQGHFTRSDANKMPKRSGGYRLRYVFPLDKSILPIIEPMKKPYPKDLERDVTRTKHKSNVSTSQVEKGGAIPTRSHQ